MRREPRHNEQTGAAGGPPIWRLNLLALALLGSFFAIGWQLTALGRGGAFASRIMVAENQIRHAVSRPDTVDRNGLVLASDIRVYWLFADPAQINGVDETIEKLSRVLSAEDLIGLRTKLSGQSRFEWVKRGLTPKEAAAVHNLGLPGLHLIQEPQRVYPAGETAVHVLGHTNVDNQGLAGIEKYIDSVQQTTAATEPADRGKCSFPSTCASNMRCMRNWPRRKSAIRLRQPGGSCSMCAPARCWPWPACPTMTRTGARNR